MALVCNRADGTISVLKIDGAQVTQTGTIQVTNLKGTFNASITIQPVTGLTAVQ